MKYIKYLLIALIGIPFIFVGLVTACVVSGFVTGYRIFLGTPK